MSEESENSSKTNQENLTMTTITPHHDYLGIVGVPEGDKYLIYCVIPRFWSEKVPQSYTSVDEIRILKQNQEQELPSADAKKYKEVAQKITQVYREKQQTSGDVVNGDDDNDDPIDPIDGETIIALSPESYKEVLSAVYRLCRYYKEQEMLNSPLEYSENALPIFLFKRFVTELAPKIRELRRSYSPIVEEVGAVRGRMTLRGMMNIKAKPSSKIECEFETFEVNSPLYRLLVTVLEVIVSTKITGKLQNLQFLEELFQEDGEYIRKEAIILRRHLAMISSLSIHQALQVCKQFQRRLPSRFRNFATLIQYSSHILQQEYDQVSKPPKELEQWWHVTAPSSKLWEQLLENSLDTLKNIQVNVDDNGKKRHSQEDLEGPWEGSGTKNIDLVVKKQVKTQQAADTHVWLLDAKYAHLKNPPNSDYQYQQFFYAMAYPKQKTGQVKSIALIHATNAECVLDLSPCQEGTENSRCNEKIGVCRYEKHPDLGFDLPDFVIAKVQFPQLSHFKNSMNDTWTKQYFKQTSSRLQAIFPDFKI